MNDEYKGSLHPFGPKTAIEKPDCSSSPVY